MTSGHWRGDILPGWSGEYSIPNTIGFDKHYRLYEDIVTWIKTNINRPYSNAKWAKIGDCIYVQIRKPRDLEFFLLRWSNG